ncbi:MAG: phage major capsid protein [Planctomycetia bacterium]|nr:phage major capsid protein [Planctomycetia bacterium]
MAVSTGKQLMKCHDLRAATLQKMQSVYDQAESDKRASLTVEEVRDFDDCEAVIDALDVQIRELKIKQEEEKRMPTAPNPAAETWEQTAAREGEDAANERYHRALPRKLLDAEGREYRALTPQHRMADIYTRDVSVRDSNLSLGRMLKGSITGDWRGADAERRAMGEGSNNLGGYLVPDALWSQVLDAARAKSAYVQAGAITVPMETETLAMPRIDADPTFAFKGENDAFSESTVGFGLVNLVSRTFGTIVKVSEELLMDAPMAADAIEQSLIRGLATALDSAALIGLSPGMSGLIQNSTIVTAQTGSVGAIDWLDLHTAAVAVRSNNHEPTAYVCDPVIAGDLDAIVSGDGTTSARLWLGPPPSIAGISRFTTTTMPTSSIIMGDFSFAVLGVRMQPRIEISRVADDAFERFQAAIRIVWRGDTAVLRPSAFHLLAGITT